MNEKEYFEKRIFLVSFITGLLVAISEFVMAFYTNSQSVMLVAVYDTVEILVVGLTLFMIDLFYKPVSESHPFGYAQVESVLVLGKTIMLITSSTALMANAVQTIFSGGQPVDGVYISGYEAVLSIISLIIFVVLNYMNRNLNSPVVELEVRSWRMDTWYCLAMSIAFYCGRFLQNSSFANLYSYFDQIIMIVLTISFLPPLIKTLIRESRNTFLFPPEEEMVARIRKIIRSIMKEYPYTISFCDITRTGRQIWVGLYIDTEREVIEVRDLEDAANRLNETLSAEFENIHCELIFNN